MDERTRTALVVAATVGLFLTIQLGALALAEDFVAGGVQATEDPGDPTNSLVYVALILVGTAGMLLAIRLGVQGVVRWVVVLTGGLLSWYVFGVLFPGLLGWLLPPAAIPVLATGAALALVAGLVVHPEWYVLDAAGIVMGAGAAGLFGVSFGLLPALLLLVVLAVYDAISVYGTEHMLTLAEGMMDLKIPVVLVVPARLSFSFVDAVDATAASGDQPANGDAAGGTAREPDGTAADLDAPSGDARRDDEAPGRPGPGAGTAGRPGGPDGGERPAGGGADGGALGRDALFIGLGDAVIPTVLVASAGVFLADLAPPLVDGLALNLPALGGMAGTVAGLLALLSMVLRGRPHAGLPLLNGGTILGYLAGALAAGVPLATALGL